MDDILVCGETQEEHDVRVETVLRRLLEAGITLNPSKCEFDQRAIKFLGHLIDGEGIHVDPEKTTAIREFTTRRNQKELQHFFGIINYRGKFSASLADDTAALRELLPNNTSWLWTTRHEEQFEMLKRRLTSAPTLTPYKLDAETMLSSDASSFGLGAAVL